MTAHRPSPAEALATDFWRFGEFSGHDHQDVLAFASAMGDLEDGPRAPRDHPDFLSAGRPEPRLVAWWRRRASR